MLVTVRDGSAANDRRALRDRATTAHRQPTACHACHSTPLQTERVALCRAARLLACQLHAPTNRACARRPFVPNSASSASRCRPTSSWGWSAARCCFRSPIAGGPASPVYGAATGQRGGLFVGGAEVRREWALPWGFDLGTGLYAGGGGGAAAPVGGGLMLRGALDPVARSRARCAPASRGRTCAFRAATSRARSGACCCRGNDRSDTFDVDAVGQRQPAGDATGLGFRRMAGTVGTYSLRGADTRRIGTVGGRAEWAAASHGGVHRHRGSGSRLGRCRGLHGDPRHRRLARGALDALPQLAFEARGSLGLGGGGGVPTEGGGIGKLVGGVSFDWGNGWRSGLEAGAAARHRLVAARRTRATVAGDGPRSPRLRHRAAERSAATNGR